jgi:hypothetical protein
MISQEELKNLQEIAETDPDFVTQYLSAYDKENVVKQAVVKNYTVKETARILGCCMNTVLNHIKNGKIKATQENSAHKRWLICESDLRDFQSSRTENKGESMATVKDRVRSKEIVDFLASWDKRNSSGFSTLTLCKDFNRATGLEITESQVGGILCTLAKKNIVERLGRGLYRIPNTAAPVQPVQEIIVEKITVPQISGEPEIPEENEEDDSSEKFKKAARLAVEEFLERHSDPSEDLAFNIEMVAKEYPKISRVEIGKAIQNMHHWSKNSPNPSVRIEKAQGMGNYVKKGKKVAVPASPKFSSEFMSELFSLIEKYQN